MPGLNLTQLGVASILVVLLLLGLRYLSGQNDKKDLECAALNKRIDELQSLRISDRDAQMERDRERSERVVALLQQTATVLEAAPRQFERALGTARESSSRAEMDEVLRQVKAMAEDIRKGRET